MEVYIPIAVYSINAVYIGVDADHNNARLSKVLEEVLPMTVSNNEKCGFQPLSFSHIWARRISTNLADRAPRAQCPPHFRAADYHLLSLPLQATFLQDAPSDRSTQGYVMEHNASCRDHLRQGPLLHEPGKGRCLRRHTV